MQDVASRLKNYSQLTVDGYRPYLTAVDNAFGSDIDFAQLIKLYGAETSEHAKERKYSQSDCIGTKKNVVSCKPDKKVISTFHIERQNLIM